MTIIIGCIIVGGIAGLIFALNIRDKCFISHDWEYIGEFGTTYQQKKCRRCGKLKVESQ